jgi:glucans biosynthesis protein C
MSLETERVTAQSNERQTAVMLVQPTAAASQRARLFFLDNLRVMLIMLVIAGHLAITYGAGGSWYYSDPMKDEVASIILTLLAATGQAFIMGLLFLIAGYLTLGAYNRKGAAAFLKGRLVRLGIPLLIYDLFINPFVIYVAGGLPRPYWDFYSDYLLHFKHIGTGPLWFVEALLLFSCVYVLWRWLDSKRSRSTSRATPSPTFRAILLFILTLAVVTFVIRIWLPLGWNFELLNLQLPYFAQYMSLFALGVVASRRNWFLLIPDSMGKTWLWIAMGAIVLFPFIAIASGSIEVFKGGIYWQAFVFALWESVVGVGLSIGLLVFFRTHANHQGKWGKVLAANSYTAYLIHAPVLVCLAYAAQGIYLYPLLKFALAVLVAVPLCFLISYAIRKLPLAHKIL